MAVLLILFLGTLGIIYGSSYYEVSNRNKEMLRQFVRMYPNERQQDNVKPPAGTPLPQDAPAFRLAVFYSVAISYDGRILRTDNASNGIFSNDTLETLALAIVASGKASGITDSLIYESADKGGYLLVGFMDNTIMQESMTTLFRYTFLFGSLTIVCLFMLAVYLAKRIVTPLEESYKKQRQFISDAGHELKTPISVVHANAELLSRELDTPNPWLENIKYENERMDALVRQLLELARTEQVSVPKERLDFSHIAEGETLPFESVAFEKRLTLLCTIDSGLHTTGNALQLKQLVSILLDNAISHSSPDGEIFVSLKRQRTFIKFSVANDGEALPPAQKNELFERFYRTDAARSSQTGHYGLGLAIAKAITTAHRGQIDVLCQNGKVIFTVLLPFTK